MANYGSSEYRPPCQWVACRGGDIPPNAVPGGDDRRGEITYVGRGVHNGDVIPGKVVRSQGCCFVAYGKVEYKFQDYQVLVSESGSSLAWLPASKGALPSGAIQGDVTESGELLYIGRASYEGMKGIGKVHPSDRRLYVPFDRLEHRYTEYEGLVSKTINF